MILALLIVPTLAGLLAFALPSSKGRRGLLLAGAAAHAALTLACWRVQPAPALHGWLALDAAGLLFLSITSALFLAAALYAAGYLTRESSKHTTDMEEGFLFDNAPEAVFIGCLLLFLAAMTLVTVSQHFGLQWIAIEATTLASAPLIYFHRHHRSLEATWKYLLICSVGIALALLANFFLSVAAARSGQESHPMVLSELVAHAGELQPAWLQAAFILFLVGYGTKMGLAPLHTWLPDAHSEAPSVISALLSGALLNCAFLGIIRVQQVCVAAGRGAFAGDMLIALGLMSLLVATVFIVGQTDYKRLLAYSSVEHMGLLALGVGLGGVGVYGAMLHAVNHSLTKALLFLTAGNILARFKTKSVAQVRGVCRVAPLTGALWLTGFLAITGLPPFGMFLSKLTILRAAFGGGHVWIAVVTLALLVVIFAGMATVFLKMALGDTATASTEPARRERAWEIGPPLALAAMVLVLGLVIPEPLNAVLTQIAATLGGAW
jgi:hydrogenase-4 component F